MRILISLCSIGAALAGLPAAAEPYDFRGLTLGASLADVRRLRYPEAPGARIVCLHDAEARNLRPTVDTVGGETETKAGAKSCGVFNFSKALPTMQAEWVPVSLKLNSIDARTTFWIVPENPGGNIESDGRLYRIALRSNTSFWTETRAAFVKRYGKPTSVEQGAFGGRTTLDNETVTWLNQDSMIRLVKRATTASRMMIVYQHNALTPRDSDMGQSDGTKLPGGIYRKRPEKPQ